MTSGNILDSKTEKKELDEVMAIFRHNLRLLRLNEKLTQNELSERLMMNKKRIGGLEEGRLKPTIEEIIKIVDYFPITFDVLLDCEITLDLTIN